MTNEVEAEPDDEKWLWNFLAPVKAEYERLAARSTCISPSRFWSVACGVECWTDEDLKHLAACCGCAEHARGIQEALTVRYGSVSTGVDIGLKAAGAIPSQPGGDKLLEFREPNSGLNQSASDQFPHPREDAKPPDKSTTHNFPKLGSETTVDAAQIVETVSTAPTPAEKRQLALKMLSAEQQLLIQWREYDSCRSNEIARRLGLPLDQVQKQLMAARAAWQMALARIDLPSPVSIPDAATAASIHNQP